MFAFFRFVNGKEYFLKDIKKGKCTWTSTERPFWEDEDYTWVLDRLSAPSSKGVVFIVQKRNSTV